jgi:hypothetical protein
MQKARKIYDAKMVYLLYIIYHMDLHTSSIIEEYH